MAPTRMVCRSFKLEECVRRESIKVATWSGWKTREPLLIIIDGQKKSTSQVLLLGKPVNEVLGSYKRTHVTVGENAPANGTVCNTNMTVLFGRGYVSRFLINVPLWSCHPVSNKDR